MHVQPKKMYCRDICVLRHVSCIFRPTSKIKSMYMQTCFFCMLHTITNSLEMSWTRKYNYSQSEHVRTTGTTLSHPKFGVFSWPMFVKNRGFPYGGWKKTVFLGVSKSNLSESSNLSKISGKDAQCPLLPLFSVFDSWILSSSTHYHPWDWYIYLHLVGFFW